MGIDRLSDIYPVLQGKPPRRLVVANGIDAHTLGAVSAAVDRGIVTAIVTGDKESILKSCRELSVDVGKFEVHHATDDREAADMAVAIIAGGGGDLMMKGLVSTDKFMRAILNKEHGLLAPKAVLSHVTVVEHALYHKLLVVGDVAIIPYPDLHQKLAIVGYLADTSRALGRKLPKVAIIAATEQVLASIPACTDAAILAKMAERGQIKNAVVDGPLSLDAAIDAASAEIKQIVSPVAGDADCLLFPNIDAGNVFYKMSTKLCKSEQAAIVAGARVPIVLSSRGDSEATKLNSIALAALLS